MRLFCLSLLLFLPKASIGGGALSIKFLKYEYPDCFDNVTQGDCDFYFQDFMISINEVPVQFANNIKLPIPQENNTAVDLAKVKYFVYNGNPFEFQFPAGASFTISFKVLEDDGGAGDYMDEDIESVTETFDLNNVSCDGDWKNKSMHFNYTEERDNVTTANITAANITAVLTFQIKISCYPNFTGNGCSICADNYYPAGNCSKKCLPTDGRSYCDNQGTLRCELHVIGAHCDTCEVGWNGTRCDTCADNYYPAGNCSKKCLPTEGRSYCDNQGTLRCELHVTGAQCDMCEVGWNGTNCDTCKIEWNGTNCDTCAENYYPSGKCSQKCVSTPGKSYCDEQGTLHCEQHYAGESCDICEDGWNGTTCEDCISSDCKSKQALATVGGLGGMLAIIVGANLVVFMIKRREGDVKQGEDNELASIDGPRRDHGGYSYRI